MGWPATGNPREGGLATGNPSKGGLATEKPRGGGLGTGNPRDRGAARENPAERGPATGNPTFVEFSTTKEDLKARAREILLQAYRSSTIRSQGASSRGTSSHARATVRPRVQRPSYMGGGGRDRSNYQGASKSTRKPMRRMKIKGLGQSHRDFSGSLAEQDRQPSNPRVLHDATPVSLQKVKQKTADLPVVTQLEIMQPRDLDLPVPDNVFGRATDLLLSWLDNGSQ